MSDVETATATTTDAAVAGGNELFAGALCCDIEGGKMKFNAGRLVGRLVLVGGAAFAGYKLGMPSFGKKEAASD